MADGEKSTVQQFIDDVNAQFRVTGTDFAEATANMEKWARGINNVFGQSRARIAELQTAVVDTTPAINRLGGSIDDVGTAISEIATASRRNVVANSEDVEKLFASTKVLGGSVKDLAEQFQNVGVGISQIGPELEKSVGYIQSIGGNTKQVMDSVRANIDQMNRYQFEGGVQGLTKMAAQASMLRFDMGETFRLADKVLDPDKAIEVASAFQRLGVSAGNLADPFQLMNQSINDPSGLQDSLAKMSKQFTYFDEQTKTFKINPQGVLTLKELEGQTQISAKEMSKMALAAAELDNRISDVNKAGLKFASEEDKQYLANIAKMGKTGKYEVELKDGTKKELASLNQDEFNELIDAQKEQPKTMEEIARAQMTVSDIIKGDVSAIRNAVVGGLISNRTLLNTGEAARRVTTTATGAVSKELSSPKAIRDEVSTAFKDVGKLFQDLKDGKIKTTDAASEYFQRVQNQMDGIQSKLGDSLTRALENAYSKTTEKTALERGVKSGYGKLLDATGGKKKEMSKPISSLIEGNRSQQIQSEVKQIATQGASKSQVDFGGGIKIDVNFNGNAADLTPSQREQIVKMFIEKMNSQDMKQYIVNVNTTDNPTKSPVGKTLSP